MFYKWGGSDILSISTFNHYSRILKVVAVILLPKKYGIIWIRGSQKGGVEGGSDVWEKFPNNIGFLFESVPYTFEIFYHFSLAAIFLRQKQIFSRESQRFLSNIISL